MTNTEIWLGEIASHIQSVKSDMWLLREIISLPNCNDCKNKDCGHKPKWGEHIRYNCPLHVDRKTEPTIFKMEQVEPQTCDTCKHKGKYAYCRLCGRLGENNYEPQTERSE